MKFVPRFIFKISLTLLISICLSLMSSLFAQNKGLGVQDSTLQKFSIEDLVRLKKMLEAERENLIEKQERDRQRGVELSKNFLTQTREENENQDMILVRVAEYYIEEADDRHGVKVEEFNKASDEYERQLKLFSDGVLQAEPIAPVFPKKDYTEALEVYDLLLQNFPESELVDEALYNKAYLLSASDNFDRARSIFQEIIDKYPESKYTPEAYLQMAEFYFQPRIGQTREETIRSLNKAAQLYKNVLSYRDSPRYDEALYKLGWSYYRLAAADPKYYQDAILYFTAVVRDVEKFQELDPEGKYVKGNIKPEALEYIAASFVDTAYAANGVRKSSAFIEQLGNPTYGIDIMENMGDIYARIVDYNNSIGAYRKLLEVYPNYSFAPKVNKKIADVYMEAQQFDLAYAEREAIFNKYNPKSPWYSNLEQGDTKDRILALDQATEITEQSLRSNIIFKLELAQQLEEEKGDSTAAYTEFAELARFYLENYPTHQNAYEINWSLAYVLDAELQRLPLAFEEYIRVSNDYLEEERREDAAENAIAVAQTMVNLRRTTVDTAAIEGADMSQMTMQDFTGEEALLAEGYDNYIKIFPNSPKTANYLASAGALYYQHKQYDLARKYYKTMVTKFPEAQQKSVGLLSLMNSYFFLGKYQDAEYVARKVIDSADLPEDQLEVAKKRVGESIFKNAERLEQEEQYIAAANEYFRVYTDAGHYREILDVSLFNSARNFETAQEWQSAINTYDTLIYNFPESQYKLNSLGKIADNYKQMEDFAGVGKTYERIYNLNPDGSDAENALYNASLFYAKAEAYPDAIRINSTFIEKYPEKPDSKNLLFENARYYLKLNDLASANRIYSDYAVRYPNDSRTIEAFYRRGEYYYANEQIDLAKIEYNKAIAKSDEFARSGRNPNIYFASEAYFDLGRIEFDEFNAIELSYPENNLRVQLRQKTDKLNSVVQAFTRVIQMGSLNGFEAMYKIAQVYEELANAISNQKLPPDLSRERELVERDRVFKASVPAYDKAVEEYKNVIINVPVLAQKLDISLTGDEQSQSEIIEEDSTALLQKVAFQDSTREVALKWFNRAEEKVSLILYTVAERSSVFIDRYLREQPPAQQSVYLSWRKILLERLVAPAINVTLASHLKNINVSSEINLENKYVTESKRKILLTSNILADEYGNLIKKAVEQYEQQIPVLKSLVDAGDEATTEDGFRSLEYNDQMLSTIDYISEFKTIALNQYENTLKFANENNIQNEAVLTTQDRLFNLSYELGTIFLRMSKKAQAENEYYTAIADTAMDPRFQLGVVYFEDQQSILKQYAIQALEQGYRVSRDYDITNVWTSLILANLVELKPAEYLGDLPKEYITLNSDNSWKVSKDYVMNWTNAQFDHSQWENATEVSIPPMFSFAGFDTLNSPPNAIWVYMDIPVPTMGAAGQQNLDSLLVKDSLDVADTLGVPRSLELEDKEFAAENEIQMPDNLTQVTDKDTMTAYFIKYFSMPKRAINGWGLITADDNYHFYLNGQYIKADQTRDYEMVEKFEFLELSDYLRVGENLVAVDVVDYDGNPRNGLRFYMVLELLPGEIQSTIDNIRREAAQNVDENELKTVTRLNKNRVVH